MSLLGLVQMNSGARPRENMDALKKQLKTLSEQGAKLIVTPENTLVFGQKEDYELHAESLNSGPLQQELSQSAKDLNIWLILGSFPIRNEDGTLSSTCLVFDANGALQTSYKKLHMFDVEVCDNRLSSQESYRESEIFCQGDALKCVDTPWGKIGLSICYDLRFPLLFAMLRREGADIIVVPAAFTKVTGAAHWEILLRARGIETQCWILAPAQCGGHYGNRQTYGHSMVIDPWGDIQCQLKDTVGTLMAKIDLEKNKEVRNKMPILKQTRLQCQLK